jgi:hypothetical protein
MTVFLAALRDWSFIPVKKSLTLLSSGIHHVASNLDMLLDVC